jgi:hypothetical protein
MLLQAILIGIATSSAAGENAKSLGPFIVCSASGNQLPAPLNNSDPAPTHDGTCLLCLIAGEAPAVLPPTVESRFTAPAEVVSFTPLLAGDVVSERHTPRQSQGPPFTV